MNAINMARPCLYSVEITHASDWVAIATSAVDEEDNIVTLGELLPTGAVHNYKLKALCRE